MSTLIGFGNTIVRCWRSSLHAGLVRALGDDRARIVAAVPGESDSAPAVGLVPREATDDVAVAVDHVHIEPVALAEPERDHGGARPALTDGREDLGHFGPEDRARRQLQRLRVRKGDAVAASNAATRATGAYLATAERF